MCCLFVYSPNDSNIVCIFCMKIYLNFFSCKRHHKIVVLYAKRKKLREILSQPFEYLMTAAFMKYKQMPAAVVSIFKLNTYSSDTRECWLRSFKVTDYSIANFHSDGNDLIRLSSDSFAFHSFLKHLQKVLANIWMISVSETRRLEQNRIFKSC